MLRSTQMPKTEESSKSRDIGQEMWKQLKHNSIPVFAGDKQIVESGIHVICGSSASDFRI